MKYLEIVGLKFQLFFYVRGIAFSKLSSCLNDSILLSHKVLYELFYENPNCGLPE